MFDLSEFQINRTDERLFKSHQSMLTVGQLLVAIDSIDLTIEDKMQSIRTNGERYFYFLQPADSTVVDSLKAKPRPFQRGPAPIDQASLDCLDTLSSIMYTFPEKRREEIFSRADTYARSVQGQVQSAAKSIQRKRESRVNHYFEMHSKFSFAVSCVIFLFIGAPMGAIVRKGGFGYPMIISILFFMAFIVLNIFSKNIAERFVIPPVQAAWLPAAVFFPMGLILTYLAMNDYHQTIDLSRFKRILEWFRKILRAVGVRF
ncbi:MAG: LptF/LptG family permease [Saprospirales bacterium]|nr:LptF/LptG family permease [Saprospirales bacterium]